MHRYFSSYRNKIAQYIPWFCLDNPCFILGCGRSGTTIIGKSISQHPDVAYLNEPRSLWATCYPQTDIWSKNSIERKGRMILSDRDVDINKSRKLKALFDYEKRRRRGSVLVEKTPVNSFRTSFIHDIFSEAKYICIFRNGVEVAKSIEKVAASRGLWFGHNDYKWKQIADAARKMGLYPDLEDFPKDDFERGLLEWRISNEYLLDFLSELPMKQYISLTYSEFVDEPVDVISKIFAFMELNDSDAVNKYLVSNISRVTERYSRENASEREVEIAGKMLSKID